MSEHVSEVATTVDAVDPGRCPLCGQPNSCGNIEAAAISRIEGGTKHEEKACSGDSHCWCQDAEIRFPAELCAQVAAPLQRQACICRRCAEGFQRSAAESSR